MTQPGGPWVEDPWRRVSVVETEHLFKKGSIFFCFIFFAYPYAPSCMVHDMTHFNSLFRISRQSTQNITQNNFTVGTALTPTISLLPVFLSSCFLLKCIVHSVAPWWLSDRCYAHCPVRQHTQNTLQTKLNMNTKFGSKTCEKFCRRMSDDSYLRYLGNYWLRQAGSFGLLCVRMPSQANCAANERGTYTVMR
jgi:hypothetical protein